MNGAPPARVTRLFIYPVKSAAGIALDEAAIDAFGFEHDRRWMVVRTDGTFLSQRTCPHLVRVGVSLLPDGITLHAAGAADLRVAHPVAGRASARPVRIWRDRVGALDAGNAAARWLTDVLGVPCALVWMHDEALRPAPQHEPFEPGRVSFADAYPFLLVSQEAVDALDERIAGQPADPAPRGASRPRITVERFRPNIVVAGAGAHAEDGWRSIRIGDVRFLVARPCARCSTTTVDPASGARGREPLRTLADYRARDGKVWFGQNLLHDGAGRLRIGAAVEVLETTTPLAFSAAESRDAVDPPDRSGALPGP